MEEHGSLYSVTSTELKTDMSGVYNTVLILALLAGCIAFDVWLYKKVGAKWFFIILAIQGVGSALYMNRSQRDENSH